MNYDDIRSDFEFLDDWEDRYRYVIELGRQLEPLPEAEKTDANRVHGCVSQVWLASEAEPGEDGRPVMHYRGESDAHIVSGLVAIMLALFSGRPAKEVLEINAEAALEELGLDENLTAQRANGLAALIKRIKADAQAALEDGA